MSRMPDDRPVPPDQHIRDRIEQDLDVNLLVEAGAGSGKTTALVTRMVTLVGSGVTVDQIAAVTFTRKAAAELRERFQDELERTLRRRPIGDPERTPLTAALRDIERGFVGTIHAFCARLLRERPLEAGVDPAFEELMEAEHDSAMRAFWRNHLDRVSATGGPTLDSLLEVGLRPRDVESVFEKLVDNPDVDFPAEPVDAPNHQQLQPARAALEAWLERALDLIPADKPARGWDDLQKKVHALRYSRANDDWDSLEGLLTGLGIVGHWRPKLVQNRWGSSSQEKAAAKVLKEDLETLLERAAIPDLIDQWMAHRYAPAIQFALDAARRFAEDRRRNGRMSFQDLLTITADLLRSRATVRQDLGRRYPRILIDEFQDTDPIQAEIAFLLASTPTEDELNGAVADWRVARPRPGALFVVGDPKQSIYRFRRADIVLYETVRDRFESDGAVLRLRANFRSVPDIAGFVNDVFQDVFPVEGDRYQPRAATMLPQRSSESVPRAGVFFYRLPKASRRSRAEQAGEDARAIAGWIRTRIDTGERSARDFMILTRRKKHLHLYARALDEAGVPGEVTGARVDVERGLEELVLLLKALADPGNPVATVAVLTGLFFGLDPDQLVEHRLGGGGFDCRTALAGAPSQPNSPKSPVDRALHRMAEWWQAGTGNAADVFLAGFIDEVGLLPDAASGELGALRTGVLLYALDAVRRTALGGDSTLVGAIAALEEAMAWADAETPVQPGRRDTVRVMNVHKAKGLEAPVVILADDWEPDIGADLHVKRDENAEAAGFLEVWAGVPWARRALAYPLGWGDLAEEERRFEDAEGDRLRYVAATRAGEELVISSRDGNWRAPWALFSDWLEKHGDDLGDLPTDTPGASRRSGPEADEILDRADDARGRRSRAGHPSYRFESVTDVAKAGTGGVAPDGSLPTSATTSSEGPRGREWGSVVHAALASPTSLDDKAFQAFCRSLLVENQRPLDDSGRPTELEYLVGLVRRVRGSELWARARRSPRTLVEVPFQVRLEVDADGADESGPTDGVGAVPAWVEGVIDLAFEESDGWVIADYKTDRGDDPEFVDRAAGYRAQVDLYARAWARLTNATVKERALFYTAQDRVETW